MRQTQRGFNLEVIEHLSPGIKEVFEWYVENSKFVSNLSRAKVFVLNVPRSHTASHSVFNHFRLRTVQKSVILGEKYAIKKDETDARNYRRRHCARRVFETPLQTCQGARYAGAVRFTHR